MNSINPPPPPCVGVVGSSCGSVTITGISVKSSTDEADIEALSVLVFDDWQSSHGPPEQHDQDTPISDSPSIDVSAALESFQTYASMPVSYKSRILNSPTLSALFLDFFVSGGTISDGHISIDPPGIYTQRAEFQVLNSGSSVIRISTENLESYFALAATANESTNEYESELSLSKLTHELIHSSMRNVLYDIQNGSREDYAIYRAGLEAQAVAFTKVLDVSRGYPNTAGYLTSVALESLYLEFRNQDGSMNWPGFIEALTQAILNTNYTGPDANDIKQPGSEHATWRDKFMHDAAGFYP